jgi:hypothetical protein
MAVYAELIVEPSQHRFAMRLDPDDTPPSQDTLVWLEVFKVEPHLFHG